MDGNDVLSKSLPKHGNDDREGGVGVNGGRGVWVMTLAVRNRIE